MTAKDLYWALGLSVVMLPVGCGTTGNLLPEAMGISPAVQEACTGVMDDAEILASLAAARVDQLNGYTQEEELDFARQGCTVPAFGSSTSAADCLACKTAVLEAAFGSGSKLQLD
ncbi:MAG: hypothetical protein V2A79_06520 [Planctomycetota bacterium]